MLKKAISLVMCGTMLFGCGCSSSKTDTASATADNTKVNVFIAASLSPADVLSVVVTDEDARACRVTVPDSQLSLAIGNKGQNARLSAKLTGWKIDIKPESGFYGEEPEEVQTAVQEESVETTEEA